MANVSFRMDDTLKRQTEAILEQLGLNMTTAMTMFAKTIVREQRLPLDLSIDPFYSAANQSRLKRTIENYESGKPEPVKESIEELERIAEDA
ncbi:type II toxin-antitoxin system RelB/DinJ family antitoxin [uncultured Oscillibacter sp.]|uniref:type II toxin-antitoxin system RelB/DinJ family antitoxin n=1 Tax=uncultured Oscillibacter sp. TaxID=876091 RepID=UPI0025FFE388|nr:type II toxin-antitoxin system RelB/DinJ family antitoxin [uncultured Oscillibacter sp.]